MMVNRIIYIILINLVVFGLVGILILKLQPTKPTLNSVIVHGDVTSETYYKKMRPLIEMGVEFKKEIYVNNRYLVRTYYDQGFSLLKMYYSDQPFDMFGRLDEFILDKILIASSDTNLIHTNKYNPYPQLTKPQKAVLAASWFQHKWNVDFHRGWIRYNTFARDYLYPVDFTILTYRIIWENPFKYKLFFSPGAPPDLLQEHIITNFQRVFVVSKDEKTIDLYTNGMHAEQHKVAVGYRIGDKELFNDLKTPEGTFILKYKQLCDTNLYEKGYGVARFFIDDKWLWGTSSKTNHGSIYFHGTRDESSIGKNKSEGCVRVSNHVIMKYYYTIPDDSGTLFLIKGSSNHNNKSIDFEIPNFKTLFTNMGWRLELK